MLLCGFFVKSRPNFDLQKLCETNNKQLLFEFWKTDFTKFFENNSSHRNFSLLTHFWQKFRETNVFTKEITLELISRNIFRWERISHFSKVVRISDNLICKNSVKVTSLVVNCYLFSRNILLTFSKFFFAKWERISLSSTLFFLVFSKLEKQIDWFIIKLQIIELQNCQTRFLYNCYGNCLIAKSW